MKRASRSRFRGSLGRYWSGKGVFGKHLIHRRVGKGTHLVEPAISMQANRQKHLKSASVSPGL